MGDWQAEVLAGDSASGPSAAFTVHATAGPPRSVVILTQTEAAALSTITARLRVRDAYDNQVPGILVSFAVIQGGGSLGSASARTNAEGLADVPWTLGPAWGKNRLRADVPGMQAVTISTMGYTARTIVLGDTFSTRSDTVTPTLQCLEHGTSSATPFTVTFAVDGSPVTTAGPLTLVCPGSASYPFPMPGITRGMHTITAMARSDAGEVFADTAQFRRIVPITLTLLSPVRGDTIRSTVRVRAHCEANAPCNWLIKDEWWHELVSVTTGLTDLDATFSLRPPYDFSIDVWDGYGRARGGFLVIPPYGKDYGIVQ